MANTLKIKRGAAATIPQGQLAEPLFTTDTYDLYIGKGSGGNQRIQNYIASGTSSQFLKGDGSLDSNTYQTALTFSSPLVNTSGTVTINQSSGSANGYLSSTDWTTFNSKEPAITAGTTSQYYRGDKTFQTLDTAAVPENGAIYFTEPRVRATVLTGLNLSGGGTIAATDSILTAFGKVQNQISALVGGATYQGTWNASTNTPTLASGTGTKGYYYVVSVAGSTNLDGITDWKIGDWAIFNGTTWDKVDNTDAVSSVNGFTGAVNLALDNISDVSAASPTNAQLLRFNGTSSLWENWTPTFEPALTKGNLTEATSSVLTITGGTGAVIGSGTTIEVASAGAAQNGVVTTGTQTFAGAKTFNSTVTASALYVNGMTAGSGAIYHTGSRLTFANYNANGTLHFEVNGGAGAMTINADKTIQMDYYTTNGFVKFSSSNGTLAVDTNTYAIISSPTQDTIAYWVNNTTIGSLATATYPSLTELSYVKGVTSSIQTQIDTKATKSSPTANTITYWVDANTIGSLATSSYPTLTELSYVKGVTSAIQTQIDGKLNLTGGTLTGALSGTSATFNVGSATTVLGLTGNGNGATIASITNTDTGSSARSSFQVTSDSATAHYFASSSTNVSTATGGRASTAGIFTASGDTAGGLAFLARNAAGVITFHTGGNTERVRIAANGAATFSSSVSATSATFSGTSASSILTLANTTGGTKADFIITENTGLIIDSYESTTARSIDFRNAGVSALSIASTGAATFSSSVQATNIGVGYAPQSNIGAFIYQNSTNYALAVQQDGSGVPFQVTSGAVVRMYVANGGNVGIGTTSPGAKLEVVGDTITQDLYAVKGGDVADAGGSIFFKTGTNGTYSPMAQIKGVLLNATPSEQQGGIAFFTRPSGAAGQTLTERVRITAAGNVGIGSTPTGWGTQVTALQLPQAVSLYSWNASAVPQMYLGANNYFDGSYFKYSITGQLASLYYQGTGLHIWYTAASGTAGNNITLNEAMRITSGGNVGIGTTSPGNKLEVVGDIYAQGGSVILEGRLTGGGGILSKMDIYSSSNASGTEPIRFLTANTERMRITSGGNVGIGNTNPASYNADANNLVVGTGSANGGITITTGIYDNGSIYFAEGTTGTAAYKGYIQYQQALDDLVFGTSGIARFTISGAGFYYLTNILASSTANAANVYVSTTSGLLAYSTSSRKYKHDIRPYDRGINDLMKMNPVYYKGINDGNTQFAGLIAEEIDQLGMKEYVDYLNNEPNALRYSNMVTILVKAIQEQQMQIEELKSKLN